MVRRLVDLYEMEARSTEITEELWMKVRKSAQEAAMLNVPREKLGQYRDTESKKLIRAQVLKVVENEIPGLDHTQKINLIEKLTNEISGYGPLEKILDDEDVTEIIVERFDRIVIEVDGALREVGTRFDDEEHLRLVVERIIAPLGRRLDWASPIVDGRLPDGSRVCAVSPPVAINGTQVAIRKFKSNISIDKLIGFGALSESIRDALKACVEARLSIVVSGGTGSGKCISGETDILLADGKLVKIEDIANRIFDEGKIEENGTCAIPNKLDISVKAWSPETGKIEDKKVNRVWRRTAPKSLYRITTKSGRIVDVTPEHPFYFIGENGVELCETSALEEGQHIGVLKNYKTSGTNHDLIDDILNSKRIYLEDAHDLVDQAIKELGIGLLTKKLSLKSRAIYQARATGVVSGASFVILCDLLNRDYRSYFKNNIAVRARNNRKKTILHRFMSEPLMLWLGLFMADGHYFKANTFFTKKDESVANIFKELTQELFGLKANRLKVNKGNNHRYAINSSSLSEYLKLFGIPEIGKSGGMVIPDWFLSLDEKCLYSWLRGLITCDGSISQGVIEHSTKSRSLANTVLYVLARAGIHGRLMEKTVEDVVYYRIGVYGIEQVRLYHKKIGWVCSKKEKESTVTIEQNIKGNTNVDLVPFLGKALKDYRERNELNQTQTAQRLGVSRRLIGYYEKSERQMSQKVARKFKEISGDLFPKGFLPAVRDGLLWDKIKKIERIDYDKNYVYDLTVQDSHTFIGGFGGIMLHNSTFLNALSEYIPRHLSIITIENPVELQLNHPRVRQWEARPANIEGKGEIDMLSLVLTGLRSRPDIIIVGEVRGKEAFALLQALNTGHDGSMTTLHANNTSDAMKRLISMVISAGYYSPDLVPNFVASGIDIVVHLSRMQDNSRKVVEIAEVIGEKDGNVITNPLVIYETEGMKDGKLQGRWMDTGNAFTRAKVLGDKGIEFPGWA
jgi:Flp pilus assembly CpaF family ATPase/intein/homing endonuclease